MQISKQNINKIPELEFIKFEPIDNQTKITAWNNNHLVAEFAIPGEINKKCIVAKKTIQMLKQLIDDSTSIDATSTFDIKSSKGKYKGSLISDEQDLTFTFNESSTQTFVYNNEIIARALEYVATKGTITKNIHGVNVGENGVVATDNAKVYLYGQPNDDVKSIIIEPNFLKLICKKKFTEIIANERQVLITDEDDINWYGTLIQGKYSPLNRLMTAKGDPLKIDFKEILPYVNIAISSLDVLNNKELSLIGTVTIKSSKGRVTIATENYNVEVGTCEQEFKMSFFGNILQTMIKHDIQEIYYKSTGHPVFTKISDSETTMYMLKAE